MATPTKQQKRAKRAASKAKQNRMVRSGQAVKPSAGDSASVEQVYNKAMESGSYDAMFEKMKEAQEGGLVPMISVFLVDPLLTLVLKGTRKSTPPTTSCWCSTPTANGWTALTKRPPWPGWKAMSSRMPTSPHPNWWPSSSNSRSSLADRAI